MDRQQRFEHTMRPRRICEELGITFPPDVRQVHAFIQSVKGDAEHHLRNNNLQGAEHLYTLGLMGGTLFPGVEFIRDEHHKLLSNRSLVYQKMRRFREAEQDAMASIQVCPTYIKGYWRLAQAVKGGHNGVQKAMPHLIEGLSKALFRDESQDNDVVTFMTEICTLIPKTRKTLKMEKTLEGMVLPLDDDNDVWSRIVHNLAKKEEWQSLALIFTGFNMGAHSELDKIHDTCPMDWNCKGVSVGSLLSHLSFDVVPIKIWGERLAIALLQRGASVDEIGQKNSMPTMHYITKLAMRTESTKLLAQVLTMYKEEDKNKLNAQDSTGNTALHILTQTANSNSRIAEEILNMLLKYGCNASYENVNEKKAIDYLVGAFDRLYPILRKAVKTVGELRTELAQFKDKGNDALKNKRHTDALQFYDQALAISGQNKQLFKDAAIVYSNKANVFYTLENYNGALANAVAAISSNEAYHKGHWWKAKTLLAMLDSPDAAFRAYMDGYRHSEANTDCFILEAVLLLKSVPKSEMSKYYNQLQEVEESMWPQILGKLSRQADGKPPEWQCIAQLILGLNLSKARLNKKITEDNIDELCRGVAGKSSTNQVQMSSVFTFLSKCTEVKDVGHWLEVTLFAVYRHGDMLTQQSIFVDESDASLHAVTRLALKTGHTSLLENLADKYMGLGTNGAGDSIFHTITKLKPLPDTEHLQKVTQLLMKKGFSANTRDVLGRLPVEYLNEKYDGKVFDMFFRHKNSPVDQIFKLKDEGNRRFNENNVFEAINLYTKAINILIDSDSDPTLSNLSARDKAVLYCNRALAYQKLDQHQQALDDAFQSVGHDGHWHKAHQRAGKALTGLHRYDMALKAFGNAYRDVDKAGGNNIRLEILVDIAGVCSNMPTFEMDYKKRLVELPKGQGHMWAQACYNLVKRNDWTKADVAYCQYVVGTAKKPHLVLSLKPLCNIVRLKVYTWGLELMLYLLECGSDRKTISLENGDFYLHAVIKITLITGGRFQLLEYLLHQNCKPGPDVDQHAIDSQGNSILHLAALHSDKKYSGALLQLLLRKTQVDPNLRNKQGKCAIDFIPKSDTTGVAILRMAMLSNASAPAQTNNSSSTNKANQSASRSQSQSGVNQSQASSQQPPSGLDQSNKKKAESKQWLQCEACDELYRLGSNKLADDNLRVGYEKLVECITQPHKTSRHYGVVRKCVTSIVKKLSESTSPEIPKCLTMIGVETYLMIVDSLASSNKWRPLDSVVRKYRSCNGKDQLQSFGFNVSVVPLVRDASLKSMEETKLQIMCNILNSKGTMGTDNGCTAIKSAISEDHYKVLGELIRRGADTTSISMYEGDTPIHATLVIVLDKDKSMLSVLGQLLDLFEADKTTYAHLHPEQADSNGNCLFHILAKAKYNSHVLKVTEMLCGRTLSSNYYNKEGKLPEQYLTKKNDRRLQFLRQARSVEPSLKGIYGPKKQKKSSEDTSSTPSFDDSGENKDKGESSKPVPTAISIRDQRRQKIELKIRDLPEFLLAGVRSNIGDSVAVNSEDDRDSNVEGESECISRDHGGGDMTRASGDMPTDKTLEAKKVEGISEGGKTMIEMTEERATETVDKMGRLDGKVSGMGCGIDGGDNELNPNLKIIGVPLVPTIRDIDKLMETHQILSDTNDDSLEYLSLENDESFLSAKEDQDASSANEETTDDGIVIGEKVKLASGDGNNNEETTDDGIVSREKVKLASGDGNNNEETTDDVRREKVILGSEDGNNKPDVKMGSVGEEAKGCESDNDKLGNAKDKVVCEMGRHEVTVGAGQGEKGTVTKQGKGAETKLLEGLKIPIDESMKGGEEMSFEMIEELERPGQARDEVGLEKQDEDQVEAAAQVIAQRVNDDGIDRAAGQADVPEEIQRRQRPPPAVQAVAEVDSDDDVERADENFDIDAQVFDNLTWEVECTAEVWKALRDKHVTPTLKQKIVRKIQLLATGDWQPHLCKKLKYDAPNLNLFEAKFSKGSRILWELAIAFSPRLSETAERRLQTQSGAVTHEVRGGRIYSEIIRVWDIVFDHDKIHRCVEKIKMSHQRGESCIIQKNLRGTKNTSAQQVPLGAGTRYPRLYAEGDITDEQLEQQHMEMQRFFPPASSNDTEYHILKFYSFSSTLVSHVLQNIETKVDFPFRVTDLEHAVINLKSDAPILLLGRSGTGKTTCCMYRLWSQFHTYWWKAKEAGSALLPRTLEFIQKDVHDISSDDDDEEEKGDNQDAEKAGGVANEAEGGAYVGGGAYGGGGANEDAEQMIEGVQLDHMHQVFITKNAVLCNEVQKNFRELSHADELMAEHVQHETEALANRLQDVQEYSFPLFVTSRQLLLMLDASIGPPYFFARKEDFSLKVDIAGWTDLDGPLSFLPLLDDDSDDEMEIDQNLDEGVDENLNVGENRQTGAGKKLKVDPRREVTYMVFVEEVWPRIKKTAHATYHPSLIWMEIMSFIKGSYEALAKPRGYLEEQEYFKLGRKRAPNFNSERETIYTIFKKYEHFKKQNSLFDETDLVHDVFRRLRHLPTRDWVIHQIYVDETQDFTQAELCLLIRLCQNPNAMFLTGDTAQSIMRGIAFRFSDLKSLFYHAKQSMQAMGKTSAIEVPKQVYQLTHNYRSHAGILSLATSILELMVEFFPESFDRLQPDQGLFHGPPPILLESCSFGDLAVLLRGNRRKTSHIEFGAHQAILVVNDAARDAIPEELGLGLVLTIYEAKGLEFDDVLLYNFFKDSQADKEWRVVTGYLEQQVADQRCTSRTNAQENLIKVDERVLKATGRPRPLDFDPNVHKVLNSELKHLYTALTRARVNVWVFDEDLEKRAPMFEFFKARSLVKHLEVDEINEKSLSETVFAEKSSPQDWIRRGEDFMRHKLYQVAAKCFGMGGDHEREKVALAHGQALKASRMKDNPRQMRDEFLHAADLYLDCREPGKAAICLQNAKEMELAVELFEKLGQYERAAEIYRRMKRPHASSRCYEQIGNFNKAVEVLYDSESYDMAIDTLRRYEMKIKELVQRGRVIPQHLLDNKPKDYYTEEKLSHRAAVFFSRHKREERMLEAVDKFKDVNDRVEFLKKMCYISQAAKILEENGEKEQAAALLLSYGRLEEANLMARKTLNEATIGKCLLATCRSILSKKRKNKPDFPQDYLLECIKDAIGMFQACNDNDSFGAVRLLQVELSQNKEDIKNAWKAFKDSKPFENEAGLVECTDWLMQTEFIQEMAPLKTVVRGVGHLFSVCQVLLEPNTMNNIELLAKYDQFYGLYPCNADSVTIHLKEKPLCVNMLSDLFRTKAERKKRVHEVSKADAHLGIAMFLLKRAREWMRPIQYCLTRLRDCHVLCESYSVDLECPAQSNVNSPCRNLHKTQTNADFTKVIEIDRLLIEFEANVQNGTTDLYKRCTGQKERMKAVIDDLIFEYRRGFLSTSFKACCQLWSDLIHNIGHPTIIGDNRSLVKFLMENATVHDQLGKFLLELWNRVCKTEGGNIMNCEAIKQTEVFLVFQFGFRFFGLHEGKGRLYTDPRKEMTRLEGMLDNEIARMSQRRIHSLRFSYTFMLNQSGNKTTTECLARRFNDAYEALLDNNPFQAVILFNKFMILLDKQGHSSFFPQLKHFVLWVEFYTTVALMMIAKIKDANFFFVLPNSYLCVVEFIEASFHGNRSVKDIIHQWSPGHGQIESALQRRLENIGWAVSGYMQKMQLMAWILEQCKKEPHLYGLAERMIILGMTMVCNVGKSVSREVENRLMSMMTHITLPSTAPKRLQRVTGALNTATGIRDVVSILGNLLTVRKRGEYLTVCWWKPMNKDKILAMQLQQSMLGAFSASFHNGNTLSMIHAKDRHQNVTAEHTMDPTLVDTELTEAELRKGRLDKSEEFRRKYAVTKISRWFREIREGRKEVETREEKGELEKILDMVTVDNKLCGICGTHFELLLEEKLQYAKSKFIGGKSVLNDETASGISSQQQQSWTGVQTQRQHSNESSWSGSQSHRYSSDASWYGFQNQAPQTNDGNHSGRRSVELQTEEPTAALYEIRTAHVKTDMHLQTAMAFGRFRDNYLKKIGPKLKIIKDFIYASGLGLDDQNYVRTNYYRQQMDIDRMIEKYRRIEREVQMLMLNKAWSTAGHVEQNLMEMETAYKSVYPHVLEVHEKLKREQTDDKAQQMKQTASANAANGLDESWEGDLLEVEPVVEEPNVQPRKGKFPRNTNYRGIRKGR